MKNNLLHRCRESIMILNNYGFNATANDKKIQVVKFGYFSFKPILTSKGKTFYSSYGSALNRRRKAILDLAKELNKKPWYYFIFH